MSHSQVPSDENLKRIPTRFDSSSRYHPSMSPAAYPLRDFGPAQNETQSLREPSPLLDDRASESMVTYRGVSPARSATDPTPQTRPRDQSKTPFEQHGLNTENRPSAGSNRIVHQDPAEFVVPSHAQENEVDMLSDLNNKDHCCRFIRYIRRVALEKNYSNNKEWMAKYAETRLEDDAMFWHIELDDDTRSNWDKLCRAILARAGGANSNSPTAFRPRHGSNQSVSTVSSAQKGRSRSDSHSSFRQGPETAPLYDSPASDLSHTSISGPSTSLASTPARSDPPRSTLARSDSSHSAKPPNAYSQNQHGRLLLRDYTGGTHYVGVSVSLYGLFKRTTEEHEALYVKVDQNQGKVYLQNSQSRFRTLGITWDIDKDCTPHLGKGSKDRAYLVYLDHNGKSSGQGWTLNGPSKDSIWTISADNAVHPIWIDDNGVRHELQVLVKHESLRLWHLDTISLVKDANAFMKDHSDYMRSYLVFEPQS